MKTNTKKIDKMISILGGNTTYSGVNGSQNLYIIRQLLNAIGSDSDISSWIWQWNTGRITLEAVKDIIER